MVNFLSSEDHLGNPFTQSNAINDGDFEHHFYITKGQTESANRILQYIEDGFYLENKNTLDIRCSSNDLDEDTILFAYSNIKIGGSRVYLPDLGRDNLYKINYFRTSGSSIDILYTPNHIFNDNHVYGTSNYRNKILVIVDNTLLDRDYDTLNDFVVLLYDLILTTNISAALSNSTFNRTSVNSDKLKILSLPNYPDYNDLIFFINYYKKLYSLALDYCSPAEAQTAIMSLVKKAIKQQSVLDIITDIWTTENTNTISYIKNFIKEGKLSMLHTDLNKGVSISLLPTIPKEWMDDGC